MSINKRTATRIQKVNKKKTKKNSTICTQRWNPTSNQKLEANTWSEIKLNKRKLQSIYVCQQKYFQLLNVIKFVDFIFALVGFVHSKVQFSIKLLFLVFCYSETKNLLQCIFAPKETFILTFAFPFALCTCSSINVTCYKLSISVNERDQCYFGSYSYWNFYQKTFIKFIQFLLSLS